MRRVTLLGAAAALLLTTGAAVSASASEPAEPSLARSKTLTFNVVFSPFTVVPTNNQRPKNSPYAVGDEIVFHDQLFASGRRAGDDVGHCVLDALSPSAIADCTMVVRLTGGNITAQFPNEPGPAPKHLALTGGTGRYRNVGGEGVLVEFGNGKGRLTLHLLGFARASGSY